MLFDQLGLEAAGPVAWRVKLELTFFGLQSLAGIAVAAVVGVGLLVLTKAKMVVQLRIQRCFDRNLGQHLAELVKIRFCLDVFGGCMSNRFQLFLLHSLPILTHRVG